MLKASKIRQSHETEPRRSQEDRPPLPPEAQRPAPGTVGGTVRIRCPHGRQKLTPSECGERGRPTGPPPTRGAPRHASGRLRHPHSPPSFPACLGTRVRKPGALVPGTPLQQRPRGCGPSGGARHPRKAPRPRYSGHAQRCPAFLAFSSVPRVS